VGREIALVPQNPMTALNPVVRIEPQITDVLELHLGVSGGQAHARALELLQAVHLREPERVLRQYPHELSGGMRQRILIAIAFACKPKLIIADEPTTALDVTVQRQILGLLKALQRTSGTAVLFVSHDLGVVSKICDDVCVIHSQDASWSRHPWRIFLRPQHPPQALLAPRRATIGSKETLPHSRNLTEELLREAFSTICTTSHRREDSSPKWERAGVV
jgi:peptide/nickel transport system ATP-binding protein